MGFEHNPFFSYINKSDLIHHYNIIFRIKLKEGFSTVVYFRLFINVMQIAIFI